MKSLKLTNTDFICYQISLHLELFLTKQPLMGNLVQSLKNNSTSKSLTINSTIPVRVLWPVLLIKSERGFAAEHLHATQSQRSKDKALCVFTNKTATSEHSCKGADPAASETTTLVFHSLSPSKSSTDQTLLLLDERDAICGFWVCL